MRLEAHQNEYLKKHIENKVQDRSWLFRFLHAEKYPWEHFPFKVSSSKQLDRYLYEPKNSPKERVIRSKDEKAGYVINMPATMPLGGAYDSYKNILNRLKKESFGSSKNESLQEVKERVVVCLGYNQRQSGIASKNETFLDYINHLPVIEGLSYRVFGFFWSIDWTAKTKEIPKGGDRAFALVQILSPDQYQVCPFDLSPPFQMIRECIKNSSYNKELTLSIGERRPKAPIYYHVMDSDFISLRVEGTGLLSRYDQLVLDHNRPSLMSLGYRLSDQESYLLRLGVKIDMAVRKVMNEIIPASCYFPEPSTCVLLGLAPKGEELKALSFMGMGQSLENRRLIYNGIAQQCIDANKIVMEDVGGVVTSTPDRMRSDKSDQFKDKNVKDIKTKAFLTGLHRISQTHAVSKQWADNLYLSLGVKGGAVTEFTGPISRLFKVFDPIMVVIDYAQFKEKTYSSILFAKIWNSYKKYALAIKNKNNEDEFCDHQAKIIQASVKALKKKKLSEETINRIILAAEKSGLVIYRLIKNEILSKKL
ncbi:MAG: hypothetical protein ACOVOR_03055 [Rhabdochlamydiaceae bacterium]